MITKNDTKIPGGYWITQIGKKDTYQDTTEQHNLRKKTNNNDQRLADFVPSRNMTVSSTFFPLRKEKQTDMTFLRLCDIS